MFKQKKLDLKILSELLNHQWFLKKMAKYITNQSIDSTYDYGINNGALGGKLLGAGGGGFILFTEPEQSKKRYKKAYSNKDYMNIKIENTGSTVLHSSIQD